MLETTIETNNPDGAMFDMAKAVGDADNGTRVVKALCRQIRFRIYNAVEESAKRNISCRSEHPN
jgi:hypothetical protein